MMTCRQWEIAQLEEFARKRCAHLLATLMAPEYDWQDNPERTDP